jgi:hypothetical protein
MGFFFMTISLMSFKKTKIEDPDESPLARLREPFEHLLRNNFWNLPSRHSDGGRVFSFARRGICFISSGKGDRDKQIPRFASG